MLVAISQRNDKNRHGDWIDSLENSYVHYLERLGARLLVIPNRSNDVRSYIKEFPVKAIILSGGNDIGTELYSSGQGEKEEESQAISKSRDSTEKKMLEIAIDKKIPVLGICRGMQFINVFFKGRLSKIDNHVIPEHNITMGPDKFKVNSFHNYGITKDDLSHELRSFAVSDDGIIEGICHPSLPVAGIQWHPERKSPDESINEQIVRAFIEKEMFWRR